VMVAVETPVSADRMAGSRVMGAVPGLGVAPECDGGGGRSRVGIVVR
jgi:hypothetical protein